MTPYKFLVYCKNDHAKTFILKGIDGMLFEKDDDIEIYQSRKGRIYKKAKGKKAKAIVQAEIEA